MHKNTARMLEVRKLRYNFETTQKKKRRNMVENIKTARQTTLVIEGHALNRCALIIYFVGWFSQALAKLLRR